jgi:peptide/nickel transport system substrate-binding protein
MRVTKTVMVAACILAVAMSSAGAATLRIGMEEDADALDPATGNTYAGRIVFDALCDKLVDIDANLQIVPQLATDWSWNEDNTALTMTLREGVVFHDGTPFDAEAVKANIERMKTMPDSRRQGELAPITGVEVVDELTVVLNLDAPFAPLLSILSDRAGMMVSPTAAASGDEFTANPVCSGPYVLADRSPRDFIRLDRFDDYWNVENIGYDRIEYLIIPDSTVRLSRLQAGDLEVVERVAPTDLEAVRNDGDLELLTSPGLAVTHLHLNLNGPLGENPAIRQALELAIDRNVINQVAFNGEFIADNQMMTPSSIYHSASHPMPERDVAAAQALLAEAGVSNPALEITFANSVVGSRVAQIIQSLAGEAGFNVTLVPLEPTSATEAYFGGNFDAYIGNWSGRADPDPTLFTYFSTSGSQNLNGYDSPEMDQMLLAARAELDEEARKAIYEDITGLYLTDLPTIPLYHPNWFYAVQSGVEGAVIYPDGIFRVTGVHPAAQ